MGNEDLGHHLEETGHLKEAAEIYSRMRHDVSTTKHIMDCAQRIISVALQRRDWPSVMTNVSKMAGVHAAEDEHKCIQPYMRIVHGLAHMGLGKYDEAAHSFLEVYSEIPLDAYNDIATPNDVAVYGGLLALATMDREKLHTRVLDNPRFRTFLEHEPQIRKAVSHFVNGRYSSCLAILDSFKADFLLDIYLHKHVQVIFQKIRRKCIVQNFIPFSCVTLDSLDASFSRDGKSIEDELASMIRDGTLNARIDSKSKVSDKMQHLLFTSTNQTKEC
jgi:COP9 signalosome complex subunit 1